MLKSELGEDISFILYLVPIPLYSIYAIILSLSGISSFSGTLGNPILFGIAVSSVLVAVISEISISSDSISSILMQNTKRLQLLSVSWAVWLLLFAIFTGSLGSIFANFGSANFGLLFPFLLMALSFAFGPRVIGKIKSISREVVPLSLIVISPFVLYLLWRANAPVIVISLAAMLFLLAGILLIVFLPRVFVIEDPAG